MSPRVGERSAVRRLVEVAFGFGIWTAALAFGGTAPPYFFPTQAIIFSLGILFLWGGLRSRAGASRLPIIAPGFLILWVLIQILPLPAFANSVLGSSRAVSGGHATLSEAPFQTVSHLLLLITYLSAFYLAIWISEDRLAAKRLAYALVALGAFEACYGLLQYLTGWQQIFAYVKKYYLEDATGTYINRNHFAGLLEMLLPFCVAFALQLAADCARAAQRSDSKLRGFLAAPETSWLAFWLFLSAVLFTALAFSRSRMGLISALASVVFVVAVAGSRSTSRHMRVAVAAVLVLGVVGIVVWIGSDPLVTRFETLGHEYSAAGQNRVSIWRDTLKLIRQRPIFGTGLGTFSVAFTSVQTTFLTLLVDHAHCDYLEVVSELGFPGALVLLGAIFWILARAVRAYRMTEDRRDAALGLGCIGGIVAILVHSLADFNLYIPANALIFSVLLGLAWRESAAAKFAGAASVAALNRA